MLERRSWIEKAHPLLSVREQCELLNVARSSVYYTPCQAILSDEQLALLRLVDEVYTKYPFFGTRKMSDYIALHHHACQRHEVRWAYEQLGLHSVAPGPHTSKPHPKHPIYPYLLTDIEVVRPCQVFSTDITYIRLQRGFVYLIAVIDWYSRFVLDWQISINMEADFCVETLERVLEGTRCDIFNTDQGSQFTSTSFTDVLKKNKIRISMDGKGRWADNIYLTSFKMRVLQHLKIVVNSARQRVANIRQNFLKKSVDFRSKIFSAFEKAIVSNLLVHNLP